MFHSIFPDVFVFLSPSIPVIERFHSSIGNEYQTDKLSSPIFLHMFLCLIRSRKPYIYISTGNIKKHDISNDFEIIKNKIYSPAYVYWN